MRHVRLLIAGSLLLGLAAAGCQHRGRGNAGGADGAPDPVATRLEDIQAQLLTLSEQVDDLQRRPAPPPPSSYEPEEDLALRPVVPVEPAPPEDPVTKKQRLQALANRTDVVVAGSGRSKSGGGKGSSLAKKHIRVNASVRQIQAALRNAGTNPGPVDGVLGKRTIGAVKAFQAQHGLKVDGIVGTQTWSRLRAFGMPSK